MVKLNNILKALAIVVAMAATGCSMHPDDDFSAVPTRIFKAEIEQDATRVCLENGSRIKWREKDSIAILQPSVKALYRFDGNTGDNIGTFSFLSGNAPAGGTVYAIHPYGAAKSCTVSGVISCTFPAVQRYEEDSFGRDACILAASTTGSTDNLKFFSASAFIVVKIFGSDYIKSIKIKGNKSEALAGEANLTVYPAAAPAVEFSSPVSEVTLECGGMPVGADESHATEFWIAIAPCHFTEGFTIEVTDGIGNVQTKATGRDIELKAGTVQPMAAIEASASGGKAFSRFALSPQNSGCFYEADRLDGGEFTVYVPWGTEKTLTATFEVAEGTMVLVNGMVQESGITVHDFSTAVHYTVRSAGNGEETYSVRAVPVELPVMFVNTPDATPVKDKVNWIYNTSITIQETDGTLVKYTAAGDDNLGNGIRGRGNSTWGFAKKPYAIKLGKKADMLGIMTEKGKKKGHKRWCLLANWRDRTLVKNDVALKIASQMPGLEWTPSGKFVELVLNGDFLGTYYLCEQIKIDANRLNINELEEGSVSGLKKTGGYLLECDTYTDETIYRTQYRKLPVKFKSPDVEDWTDKTEYASLTDYMIGRLNAIEAMMSGVDTTLDYKDYIDVYSFIDYWLMNEIVQNIECVNGPRSCYMYKKRDISETQPGKLYAGPVWDYDCETFHKAAAYSGDKNKSWNRIQLWYLKLGDKTGDHYYRNNSQSTAALYYGYLFKDPDFQKKVVERWNNVIKPALSGIPDYITTVCQSIKRSAERNAAMWPNNLNRNGDETMPIEAADALLLQVYKDRVEWMDKSINSPDFCVAK